MFNWFGKKKDIVGNTNTVSTVTEVRQPTQSEIQSQIEKQLFREYGDKRNYTFPDGKTITWELKIEKVWGRCEIKDTVIEYFNGERWDRNTQLKYFPTLTPPASQLFLILLNDQRNIKYTEEGDFLSPKRVYTHSKLGIVYQEFVCGSSIEGLNSIDSRDIANIKELFWAYNYIFNLTSRQERYEAAMQKRAKSLETRKLDAYLKTIAK
jgi:hypothetical protein